MIEFPLGILINRTQTNVGIVNMTHFSNKYPPQQRVSKSVNLLKQEKNLKLLQKQLSK